MSTFYPQNDYRGYLSHHGIKGQRWGKKNGPPYPLSDRLHSYVIKKQAKMKENKEKRDAINKEKRKQKILHDPAKLYKHAPEFSTEELDNAVAKIDAMNRVKSRIPGNSEKELDKKIKKLAPSAVALEKNSDKFTTDELEKATRRLTIKHDIHNKKMSELDRPRKFLQLGSDILGTIASTLGNAKKIKDIIEPKYDINTGLTKEETRLVKLYETNKNNPDKLESLGVGVDKFADRLNKVRGKDTDTYESFFKSSLEDGSISWDDIPENIQDILKDKKGFKQYSS